MTTPALYLVTTREFEYVLMPAEEEGKLRWEKIISCKKGVLIYLLECSITFDYLEVQLP